MNRLIRFGILAVSGVFFVGLTGKQPNDAVAFQVPDGFTIESVVDSDLLSYPMFASFDGSGRLFVFEATEPNIMGTAKMLAEPSYHVRLLEDLDGDGKFEKSQIFADNIPFPKGGVFYKGSLYVSQSPSIVKYTDTDGDGKSDKSEVIMTGWTLHHNGATLGGPFMGPDGWFYITDARRGFNITTKEGKNLKGKTARIWRMRPDGSELESMAGGGFDNSIEIAFMPSGETIGTMTYFVDPSDGQRDALMHWVEGGTYPKYMPEVTEDAFKLTGELMPTMAKMPRVAPSGIMRYRGKGFGDAYEGNLFNAEFNTGRIMRHIVKAEGASYTTEEEVFIKATSPDSHPTDVLQDADGSMLVVLTGGWFIEGCPLSRVAKPDVRGGIYRLRKKGAPAVKDPWGKKINLEALSAQGLMKYLTDPKSAVRDRAIEQIISKGESAVAPLLKTLPTIANTEEKAAALFALSRIATPSAIAGVRLSLNDKSPAIRTAAIRALGLVKDKKSFDKLTKMVVSDVPQVRRQAATALGQIGDAKAVPALLAAAAVKGDRFVDHAIIYSLITLGNTDLLNKALESPSSKTRIAALVALDQMDGKPLRKEQVVPVLESQDETLRGTGLWLMSHHPEWTDIVVNYLAKTMQNTQTSAAELASVKQLMLTFVKQPALEGFVKEKLDDASVKPESKLFLLDIIAASSLKKLPSSWVQSIGKLLESNHSGLRSQSLGLIESRRIGSLNGQLDKIIQNPSSPVDLQLKAMSAKILSSPELSASEFSLLEKYLGKTYDSPIRQSSVRLLSHAKLNKAQLLSLAQNKIKEAESFLLPSLLETFANSKDTQVGSALITALKTGENRLDNLSETDLKRILSGFSGEVQNQAAPLIATLRAQHAERLAHLQKMEQLYKGGDVGEGRKLFYGKAACSSCHSVGAQGGVFGPDLTNIGEIRSKHDILEAIVYPSASFAREYETFKVVTNNGSYMGVIKDQLPESIVIEVGPAPGIHIARADIKSIEPQTLSMMPPGLDQQLNTREMSDLVAFLEALPYRLDRMIKAKESK